jgi:undecaprenyl diphosphate synthase
MATHKDDDGAEQTGCPRHVAIIMDGNGRWAESHGLPRSAGHHRGVEAVRSVVAAAREIGIHYLTLYSFSSENWSRPATEVALLMGLLRRFLRSDLADLHRNAVRVKIIGERAGIAADIVAMLDEAEALTAGNEGLRLQIAFNYGARDEITRAVRRIATLIAETKLDPANIDADMLARFLDTAGDPDPDLLIRTGGEMRLSNFLLWQAAYTELVFTPVYWPDFNKAHLDDALGLYQTRDRRFGGLKAQAGAAR